jgi:hypothetical protein
LPSRASDRPRRAVVTEPDDASEAEESGHEAGAELPVIDTPSHERSVHWLSSYVYGTISTLVAIAGLTFETNPGALTTAGVVVV